MGLRIRFFSSSNSSSLFELLCAAAAAPDVAVLWRAALVDDDEFKFMSKRIVRKSEQFTPLHSLPPPPHAPFDCWGPLNCRGDDGLDDTDEEDDDEIIGVDELDDTVVDVDEDDDSIEFL